MPNPSKENNFSSAGRFPSSSPQRSHFPTDETLAVVDVNDPSITRNYVVGGFNFGGGIADLTTSGNIVVGGGGGAGVVERAEKPSCRVCNKTFLTLRAVYGHMQVHSCKRQRGSTSTTLASSRSRSLRGAAGSQVAGEGNSSGWQGRSGEGGSSSAVRVPMFDLNPPVEGAADPAQEGNVYKNKNLGFDLNEVPADEDEP